MGGGRQVSQATFDAIVREAINDFGHTPEEAIKEAQEQLKMMGVNDFSNLLMPDDAKDSTESHAGVLLSDQLRQAEDLQNACSIAADLTEHIRKNANVASVAGSHGAVPATIRFLKSVVEALECEDDENKSSIQVSTASHLIAALCTDQELNRARFVNVDEENLDGVGLLLDVLLKKADFDEDHLDWATISAILAAIAAVQHKSEVIKQRIVANGTLDNFIYLLDVSGMRVCSETSETELIVKTFQQTCHVIRQLIAADDSTVNVSETFNRARALNGGSSVMSSGLRRIQYKKNATQVLSQVANKVYANNQAHTMRSKILIECIKTIKMCMIADEVCKNIIKLEFHGLVIKVLDEFQNDSTVVHACIAMLRNLSNHDEAKTFLLENIELVINAIGIHAAAANSNKLFDHYAGLLSGICLRRSDISDKLVALHAFQLLFEGMTTYKQDASLQKISCIAIRNACSRDGHARHIIRSGKQAEQLVRTARRNFPRQCEDVAYDCLYRMDVLKDHELRKLQGYTLPADMLASSGS